MADLRASTTGSGSRSRDRLSPATFRKAGFAADALLLIGSIPTAWAVWRRLPAGRAP